MELKWIFIFNSVRKIVLLPMTSQIRKIEIHL